MMKRGEKSPARGRGRRPKEAPAVTPERAEVNDPQVEAPGPGPAMGDQAHQEVALVPPHGDPISLEPVLVRLLECGIAPGEVRSMRWDERRRVLTVMTRDFAIHEIVGVLRSR